MGAVVRPSFGQVFLDQLQTDGGIDKWGAKGPRTLLDVASLALKYNGMTLPDQLQAARDGFDDFHNILSLPAIPGNIVDLSKGVKALSQSNTARQAAWRGWKTASDVGYLACKVSDVLSVVNNQVVPLSKTALDALKKVSIVGLAISSLYYLVEYGDQMMGTWDGVVVQQANADRIRARVAGGEPERDVRLEVLSQDVDQEVDVRVRSAQTRLLWIKIAEKVSYLVLSGAVAALMFGMITTAPLWLTAVIVAANVGTVAFGTWKYFDEKMSRDGAEYVIIPALSNSQQGQEV